MSDYNPKNPDLFKQVELPAPTLLELNIVTLGSGQSALKEGDLISPNFRTTKSGFRLRSDGDVEFNSATIRGQLIAGSIDIPDTTTANSFHVDSAGNAWWGATTLAGAVASVTKAGAGTFSNLTITGGSISSTPISSIPNNSSTDISLLEKTWTMVFSVTDADTIAWTAGTITLSNGRTFAISAGNTGNMSALTYIYLDPSVSSTVLQTTTTAATAMGANKILVGTAQNNTVTASFIPYGPGQPLVDGANIGALSIVAGNIAANTITAGKLSVSQLSAIAADLGTITAGTITVDSTGYVRSGQTDYNTGTGFFLGRSGGATKFSIGNPATYYLTWDGSTLTVKGTTPDIQVFTSSGTWSKPAGALFVRVVCIGGGGGGGGGRSTNDSGGSGGGGGAISERIFRASDLASTVSVTVGAGGSGGGVATNGSAGGTSSFGSHLSAYGGGGGTSANAVSDSGGGGGGNGGVGQAGQSGADSLGGSPASSAGANGVSGQGGGGRTNNSGRNAEYGGGAGGGNGDTLVGGSSLFGAGGGGGGGEENVNGGAGGSVGTYTAGGGGAGGVTGTPGTNGTAGTDGDTTKCGTGGGGGGGGTAGGNGGNGGAGGAVGGGGGGGGADQGGATAGTGGAGGRGQVMVYST
jgi:hypothetical protein